MNYFRTNHLAICPYLVMNGLQFKGAELSKNGKVFFVFEDPDSRSTSLRASFPESNEFKYKNHWQTFRNIIDDMKGNSNNGNFTDDVLRKTHVGEF